MSEPAYREMDVAPQVLDRLHGIIETTGPTPPTVADLKEALDRNGPDDAILEVALLLPVEQYEAVREHFNAQKRRGDVYPRRPKTRSRQFDGITGMTKRDRA
jgi:hypothetical protein